MNDLENHIISKDILKTCQTVALYGCKKKVKPLITFYISQYSDHYMNDNMLFIQFMYDRIQSIQDACYSISKRIVRVSLCELFVALIQLQRQPKIKMLSSKKNNDFVTKPFHMSFRNTMMKSTTFISGVKQLCNLDDMHEKVIHSLIYYYVHDYQPKIITESLSTLFKYKAIINLQKVKQQPELTEIKEKLSDNFYSLLVFLCISLCKDVKRKTICESVLSLFLLKPTFNLLLLAFNIGMTPSFNKVYSMKNTFYIPVILQCTIKVDYLYQELCQTEFSNLVLDKEKLTPEDYKSAQTEEDTDEDFDVLFTMPEKKPYTQIQPNIDLTQNQIKVIILKNQNTSQGKDKNMYNISKKV